MIYAIADIHGCLDEFKRRLDDIGSLMKSGDTLVLLGDYIDRGPESAGTLAFVRSLTERYENVVALRGNHEEGLLGFLDGGSDYWYTEDKGLISARTFLAPDEAARAASLPDDEARELIRSSILRRHGELVDWVRALPYYFETERAIFVHASVDEGLGEGWRDSDTRVFLNKSPVARGRFYKDIVGGHIRVQSAARDPNFDGIFWDGASHYTIDGAVERGGRLLVLAIDGGSYYELAPGTRELLSVEDGTRR